jgi:hypothetical protein
MPVRAPFPSRRTDALWERPRRLHKRYPAEGVLAQVLLPGLPGADAWPVDLSTHGAGLILPWWLEPGTILTLRLFSRRLLFCWTGEVRLTHCRPMRDGLCRAGGDFVEPLPQAALGALLL